MFRYAFLAATPAVAGAVRAAGVPVTALSAGFPLDAGAEDASTLAAFAPAAFDGARS
jgi:hypothetical protein